MRWIKKEPDPLLVGFIVVPNSEAVSGKTALWMTAEAGR